MQCFVYRSSARADTYVFLRGRDDSGVLPRELAAALGPLVFVLELELVPGRRLARIGADELRDALVERGFHVQFPPRQGSPDAFVVG
ncbi:MAG: YcgL domain-containing protein [Lysobacteraceae bacterium]|nr:MAG: YcgL domain-containing protein [Xanthomonadaceae bacterium]